MPGGAPQGMLGASEVLARCPLFVGLGDDDLAALAAVATRRRYADGEHVFVSGADPVALHLVVAGAVTVYVLSPQSGRELVLTVEHPYHAVAELASFDRGPYPANARALGDTELVVLEQDRLDAVLRERPAVCLHLLRTLGRRLRRLVGIVERLSFQEVVHRLADHLLERARAAVPFELDTNAHMAARIGTVPELVSRNLSRLHGAGAITLDGRTVVAADLAALDELAGSAGR